jgi:hypothetical protein
MGLIKRSTEEFAEKIAEERYGTDFGGLTLKQSKEVWEAAAERVQGEIEHALAFYASLHPRSMRTRVQKKTCGHCASWDSEENPRESCAYTFSASADDVACKRFTKTQERD